VIIISSKRSLVGSTDPPLTSRCRATSTQPLREYIYGVSLTRRAQDIVVTSGKAKKKYRYGIFPGRGALPRDRRRTSKHREQDPIGPMGGAPARSTCGAGRAGARPYRVRPGKQRVRNRPPSRKEAGFEAGLEATLEQPVRGLELTTHD